MSRDLVCFSHLRWDFVFQRPNHLMARAAQARRVFFVEEPLLEPRAESHFRFAQRRGVTVVTPVLARELPQALHDPTLTGLIDRLFRTERIHRPIVWYYTPMALPWSRHVDASLTVFDSMNHWRVSMARRSDCSRWSRSSSRVPTSSSPAGPACTSACAPAQ